jgi:hypothetical protein
VVLLILVLIATAFCCFHLLFAASCWRLEQLFVRVVIGILPITWVCRNISGGEKDVFNSLSSVYFPLDFGRTLLVEKFEGFHEFFTLTEFLRT